MGGIFLPFFELPLTLRVHSPDRRQVPVFRFVQGDCERLDEQWGSSGARLTKAYDDTIQRYRNSHAKIEDSKMHILRCMGSKFVWNFKGALWNFTHNFEPIPPQNMNFRRY